MAPRGAARRSEVQVEEYRELGIKGRKTGTLLPNLGPRDEHGMAPLDGLFSSPEKQTPDAGDDRTQGAMDMDLETDEGPGPLSILKGAHKLLPRGTSPRKTNMQSPAIRNPLLGRSSSPVRGTIVDSDPVDPVPAQRTGPVARKLNYSISQPNGGRPKVSRANGTQSAGRKRLVESDDEEEDDEPALPGGSDSHDASNGHDDSLEMIGGDDTALAAEEEAEADESLDEPPPAKNPGRRPGRPAKAKQPEPEPEPEPDYASESEPEPLPAFDDEPTVDDAHNDSDVTMSPVTEREPKPAAAGKKRGRPPGKQPAPFAKPAPIEKPVAKQPGKRGRPSKKSLEAAQPQKDPTPAPEPEPEETTIAEEAEEDGDEEDEDPRPAKRSRIPEKKTAKAGRGRGRPKATPASTDPTLEPAPDTSKSKHKSKTPTAEAPRSKTPVEKKAPAAKRGRGRPSKSNAGEDSVLETVQKGPPLPKSRGLYSVRREDSAAIITTRSGRHSYAPLHFWRNERVLYNDENDVWEDGVNRGKHDRFVLPTTKGVVRVEEEPAEQKRKPRGPRPKAKSRGRSVEAGEAERREPPEPWEQDEGRIEGETIVWDPDYEFNPPAPDEPVSFEINQLAVSSDAIETRNVRDASFRFTKLLSMPFFGAGIVDLPPGSEKKPKNSRKNHMTFFVHYGKVLVTVNETQFRISAGGYWNVPRGNYYNIQNDYEQPARLFFTQGCEMMIPEPDGRSILDGPNDTTVGI